MKMSDEDESTSNGVTRVALTVLSCQPVVGCLRVVDFDFLL